MVTIEGLSLRQRELADIIWSMDSQESCQRFILSLPDDMRRDAETIVELIILAICDECQDVTEAQHLLKPYRLSGL